MLIRFQIRNLYSFKEDSEFNLLPGRIKRFDHHKYERGDLEFLKLTAIYGANGSGKSNLIRGISLLRSMVLTSAIPREFRTQKFRLAESAANEPVDLAIEFFTNNTIYYYSIAVNEGVVVEEHFSSNGQNQEDEIIFKRQFANGKTVVNFFSAFEETAENKTIKKVIETDLLKPCQPLFTLLNTISNDAFVDIRAAFKWFKDALIIIYPHTKTAGLVLKYEGNKKFQNFAKKLMRSLNTGISDSKMNVTGVEEYFGKGNQKQVDELKTELKNFPGKKVTVISRNNEEEVVIVNDNGRIVAERLLFEHQGEGNKSFAFAFNEESDGTRRLLAYLPALNSIIERSATVIIDGIESSIHPLIIKEIIDKFSNDETTKGQLIFTTHESNLLDQNIFRTDEIWFAEKDSLGATKLYPLSDFKEHSTIDIRKGYLNGRYGAVPSLGNLKDVNWHQFSE